MASMGWHEHHATDYAGDSISHALNLTPDTPDFTKSFTVGGVGAATSPLLFELDTFGTTFGSKIFAGTYNSLISGATAFGATAITTPSSSPDLSGGIATVGSGFGAIVQGLLPGPAGQFFNQLIQSFAVLRKAQLRKIRTREGNE